MLEDLHKAQKLAFWELRDLEPEGKRSLSLDLTAKVPGKSIGPASRTYLYYTPQAKRWTAPLAIDVTAQ